MKKSFTKLFLPHDIKISKSSAIKFTIVLQALVFSCLTSCSEKPIKQDFDSNIDKFNDFYHSNQNNDSKKPVLIVPGAESMKKMCKKATIKADDVKISELASILKHAYGVNVNYAIRDASNIDYEIAINPSNKNQRNTFQPIVEEQRVTLDMTDICLEDVLDVAVDEFGLGFSKLRSGGFNIYPKMLRSKMFTVNYHGISRSGVSSMSISDSSLDDSTNSSNKNYTSVKSRSEDQFWDNIALTLDGILNRATKEEIAASRGQIDRKKEPSYAINKESGVVVVNAFPKQLRYIENFFSKVNNASISQVLIEAKILEVELTDELNRGIQWDALKGKLKYTSFASAGQPINTISAVHGLANVSSEDVSSGFLSVTGNSPNNGFNAVVQALSSQGNVSVLSSTRILALNNQKSLIKYGDASFYPTNISNLVLDSASGSNNKSRSSFELESFFSGTALDVTPRILDEKQVLLHIHPVISRVESESRKLELDGQATVIPSAKIHSREADTILRASCGDVIVLGGMTRNYVQSDHSGLPVKQGRLSKFLDIFASKKQMTKKSELIILIKPTIVTNDTKFDNLGTYDVNDH